MGIAADTVLGAAYTANLNRTLTLYGMQTYLLIFDVDKFKILQSFLMRIMSARDDEGNIGIKDELISSELLNHLGYRPPKKDRKNIWLPNLIRENLDKVNPRETQPVNLRVTDVTVTKFTQKWLDKQKKTKTYIKAFWGIHSPNQFLRSSKLVSNPIHHLRLLLPSQSHLLGEAEAPIYFKKISTQPQLTLS